MGERMRVEEGEGLGRQLRRRREKRKGLGVTHGQRCGTMSKKKSPRRRMALMMRWALLRAPIHHLQLHRQLLYMAQRAEPPLRRGGGLLAPE
jgi:hypothetical protein